MPPALSVVIPTHERRASLLRLLEGLAAGSLPPDAYEVVVAPDRCTDGTAEAVRARSWPFALRVIEPHDERGAAAARNRGAAHARGAVLVFVDDDIEPLPTLLAAHAALHRLGADGEPGAGALAVVGAPIPLAPPATDLWQRASWGWWQQQLERLAAPGHRFGFDDVYTGILSLPRALFHELGGFDTSLPASCRDDFELGQRLVRRGVPVVFSREGGGWHHEVRGRARLLARKRAEGTADLRLVELHPELWPRLRLSDRARPGDAWTGGLRRVALAPAWAGALVAGALSVASDLLAHLRARRAFGRAQAGLVYLEYWRGAARALGGGARARRALDALAARVARGATDGRSLELDLAAGLGPAERRLDAERPEALVLRLGPHLVGRVPALPGAEPLRGAHLRRLLARELALPLETALALHELAAPERSAGATPGTEATVPISDATPHAGVEPAASAGPAFRGAIPPGIACATARRRSRQGPEPTRAWTRRELAALPAPVQVRALDLEDGLAAIEGCAGASAVRLLVRVDRRPLGWITIAPPGEAISRERLRVALEQLGGRLGAAVLACRLRREARARGERDPTPPISVVVCTHDRAASLARCLAALRELDYPEYEVVVVDNAPSSTETAELVASFPARYVREDRPGLDWARNRGVAAARHGLVAFTDDDVRVDRHWLSALARAFADPETMLVTGRVAPAELDTEAQVLFEFGYGGMEKGERPMRWHRDEVGAGVLAAHHLGVGASMAFRRRVFDTVGLFDTALDVGTPARGAGDLDMFHRVLASGAVARYAPDALAWHVHRRTLEGLRAQIRDNGCAFGVYLLKRWAEAGRRGSPISRLDVAAHALGAWLPWLALPFVRREPLPIAVRAQELLGALEAPRAARAARRNDCALRRLARPAA